MTRSEFFEIAGYFANPTRETRIEIEARKLTLRNYALTYHAQTGLNLQIGDDSVTELADSADKWGREMRLYFNYTEIVPMIIGQKMTVGGRPGYEQWNQRLNSKDIIDTLFECGFVLGDPQDEVAIRAAVPSEHIIDFDKGYDIP